MEIREQKKRLRRTLRLRAEALTEEYRGRADESIAQTILKSAAWRQAEGVFVYVGMPREPDTMPLLLAALRTGKRLYVPLCCPGRELAAVRIRSLDELRPGIWGIPEPPMDSPRAAAGEIGLAVVPCVSATREGGRLGHGAGYYDRFLRGQPCRSWCLCYEELLSALLPLEEHDVPMDAVVTEKGLFQRNA